MSNCKYCNDEIFWVFDYELEKYVPIEEEPDPIEYDESIHTKHKCSNSTYHVEKEPW